MRNVVQLCLATNNILLMRKRNLTFLLLAIALAWKMADRFNSRRYSLKKNKLGDRMIKTLYFTLLFWKMNKGDLPLMYSLWFLVWIHRFSRRFGFYCVTHVTATNSMNFFIHFIEKWKNIMIFSVRRRQYWHNVWTFACNATPTVLGESKFTFHTHNVSLGRL